MTVVLRNGKVVYYNEGYSVDYTEKGLVFIQKKGQGTTFIAVFPWDVVERIDAEPPCKVLCEAVPPK